MEALPRSGRTLRCYPFEGTAVFKRPSRLGRTLAPYQEAPREKSRRDIAKVEKPGRLELAILEWQRQLVAKRAARGESLIREREQPRPGLAA